MGFTQGLSILIPMMQKGRTMWDYTDKVKDHFLHPRNVGELENPDGVGEVGNITCGDALRISFKLDENKRIKDIKFKTFGCGSAIASSSALTEIVRGMTIEEALNVSNKDIADYLGGLPEEKMHCSVMGREALEAAVASYRGEKINTDHDQDEGKLICKCFGVTDAKIKRVVMENNLTTVQQVTNYCKAGGGCTACHFEIENIIEEVKGNPKKYEVVEPAPKVKPKLSVVQRVLLIQETIDNEIKPLLKADGGDIDLVDIAGNKVMVKLIGTCSGCVMAESTIKHLVEAKLREFVSEDLVVVGV